MNAVVVHHNINSRGGEEKIAINTIELLNEMGFRVELVTSQKPDFKALNNACGREINIHKVISLPFKFNYLGIYQRLLTTLLTMKLNNIDILINTYGDLMHYYSSAYIPHIVYMHFPILALMLRDYPSKYQNSLFWKAYFLPYKFFTEIMMNYSIKTNRKSIILTNSRFSAEAIRKLWPEIEPIIVYPPVNIETFSRVLKSNKREDKVLVVSRITPEKRLENAIKLASMLPESIKVQIIGSFIPSNRSYLNYLQTLIKEYNLEKRVEIKTNVSLNELIDSMASSSVYLHTMVGEHFGISIVEAMAAGLITIVPNYGGPTEFVPQRYHYSTLEEAANLCIEAIEAKQSQRDELNAIANRFSEVVFKQNMKKIIEQALAKANIFDGKT